MAKNPFAKGKPKKNALAGPTLPKPHYPPGKSDYTNVNPVEPFQDAPGPGGMTFVKHPGT